MTSFSGCVLPVGPRFEGPPATENFAPVIISSMPQQGSTVTVVGATQMFTTTVTDPNVGDTIYARWLGEYPTYSPSSFIIRDNPPASSASGQSWDANPSITTSCVDPYAAGQPRHNITLLVSDRPFWEPGAEGAPTDRESLLTKNRDGTQIVQATWALILSCPGSN